MMPARSFAVFDLDQTLLPFDTQALFCNFVLKRHRWRVVLHAIFLPVGLARARRLVSSATARRAFHAYLWGMRAEALRTLAREFAETTTARWVYPELRAEIAGHRHEGRVLILNTASPDFYARDLADALGLTHCVATRFDIGDRVPLMPAMPDGENIGDAKVTSMARDVPDSSELTDAERTGCWSYSDTDADLPLLECAGQPVCVHPTAALAAIARRRGWRVLTPVRPWRTRWGFAWSAALQFVGLHSG